MVTPHDSASSAIQADLDGHYPVSTEQRAFFRDQGYLKLKQVLSPATLAYYGEEITRQVKRLNTLHLPMAQRDTYQKAFLQVINIWTKSEVVKEFVFSRKLARIAADLLGVAGVRLYHDQALYKEPGGGITPWHADQYYWPLSSEQCVTVWVPLQATPREMGPLAFARQTHRMAFGRDLGISDDSERLIQKSLQEAQADIEDGPFDLGEVSYHYGWTFHRAGPNQSTDPRRVMTVIYVDEDMRLIAPDSKAREGDRAAFAADVPVGGVLNSPLTPVIWSSRSE
jgi:ectoine hydroxylase-related dioxygenase (phytanoyl-CoA dioxygenase family)